MMVPWLMMMTTTTVFDVAVSAYLLSDTVSTKISGKRILMDSLHSHLRFCCLQEFNPFVITLFVIDFLFCGLNVS
jgi:hypothetical protein